MRGLLGLTPLQSKAWSSRAKGLSVTQTAKTLETFKQNVHQTLRLADIVVSKALLEVAEANRLEVRKVDSEKGILWGHQRWLGCDVIVTFSSTRGVKVWYRNSKAEKVTDSVAVEEAKSYLLDVAEERGIHLVEQQKRQHPSRLAETIFLKLIPEMKQ